MDKRIKKIIFKLVFISVLLMMPPAFGQAALETITITTYYPAPHGVYNRLLTQTLGVGDNNNDGVLNGSDAPDASDPNQAGNVWIRGGLGINTAAPRARLEVNNTIMFVPQDNDPTPPTSPAGTLYYNSAGQFKYHDGSAWRSFGSASLGATEQKDIYMYHSWSPLTRDISCSDGYIATKVIMYTDNRCAVESYCNGRCAEAGEIHRIGLICRKLENG